MYVDFIYDTKTKTVGPFMSVEIENVTMTVIADREEIAFYNRDESFWSEDWETPMKRIVIRQ